MATERDEARQLIDRLQARYAVRLRLTTLLWEDLPLSSTMSFQEGIDQVVLSQNGIDVAVFILWRRLGSPLGAAITRPDGAAYRSGTEREFDLMLAASRQSGGKRPRILTYVREDHQAFSDLLAATTDADSQLEMIQQKKLVTGFIAESFHDRETGANIGAYHTFDRPPTFAERLRVHMQGVLDDILGESTHVVWDMDEKDAPYRGLDAYDVDHGPIFFGREQEVCELQGLLRRGAEAGCGFALVVGASGSGKSSLVRAGLIPALRDFEMDETVAGWRHAILLPGDGGGDLCGALATALTGPTALPELDAAKRADLADYLRRDPETAWRLILKDTVAAAGSGDRQIRLLLLVDQLEEIFTDPDVTAAELAALVTALGALARQAPVRVVATVRSDFYGDCQSLGELMTLVHDGSMMNLLAPRPEALGLMITQPAFMAGLRFEADADSGRRVDQLVLDEALADPEALPLLADLLRELCERRDGHLLTIAAYTELGGVAGALGKRAEAIYAALPEATRAVLSSVLQALVTVRDDDAQATRRRAALASVTDTPEKRQLVQAFVAGRLLTTDQDAGSEAVISVSHEALLRAWDRVARWIDDNREFLKDRARVAADAQRWAQESRDPAYLLAAGKPLVAAEALLLRRADLSPLAASFIDASRAHHAQLATRARRRTRMWTTTLAALAVVSVIAALIAGSQYRVAAAAQAQAETARAQAEAEQTRAEESAELAEQSLTDFKELAARAVPEFMSRAETLMAAGDFAAALESARTALVLSEGQPHCRLLAATIALCMVQPDECRAVLDGGEFTGEDATTADTLRALAQAADITSDELLFRQRFGRYLLGAGHPEAAGVVLNGAKLDAQEMKEVYLARIRRHYPGLVVDGQLTGVEYMDATLAQARNLRDMVGGILKDGQKLEGAVHQAGTFRVNLIGQTNVDDLSPLAGIPITYLWVEDTKVSDLSPVRGMPLTWLNIVDTRVSDLTPLSDIHSLERITMNGTPVADLTPLRGLRLERIQLESCTKVADISPLQGMPLVVLGVGGTQVTDLSPIAGAPLDTVYIGQTAVSDLSPLKGAPIHKLYIHRTRVADLSPLSGMPLEVLLISATPVRDLSPLAGMKLRILEMSSTRVEDLSPLRGMPLETLDMNATTVTDIRPLIGMPLRKIIIAVGNNGATRQVQNPEVLMQLPLETLEISWDGVDISFLREHPSVKIINKKPVAHFWREFDAKQK